MTYRILTLDGGGSWALIEVRALIEIFGKKATGHQVLSHFDMAASNSGGSLVLGGLIANYTLQELDELFHTKAQRKSIFPSIHGRAPLAWLFAHLFGIGPRYSSKRKLTGIQNVLNQKKIPGTTDRGYANISLSEAAAILREKNKKDIHLMMVGFDYDRNRAKFFRSADVSGTLGIGAASRTVTLAEAIHASTNAPVQYFNAPAHASDGHRYWDGAISGCNNPVLAAVTEAIALPTSVTKEIAALSLGTGSVVLPGPYPEMKKTSPYVLQQSGPGLISGILKLAKAVMAEPVDSASYTAHVMTGQNTDTAIGGSHIVRMNPMLCPVQDSSGAWTHPKDLDETHFKAICALDMDAIKDKQVALIDLLTGLWLEDKIPNQPIRMNGDTLACEIGDKYFSNAMAHWRAYDAPPVTTRHAAE